MALVYIEQLEDMSVEQMQKTHEDEIKILNEIDSLAIQHQLKKATLEELESKIDEYIEHVKMHFANEERLMQEYGFPSYDMHKTAHDMFLADLMHSVNQWKQYGNVEKIINFVRKTPEWIFMHVNSVDAPTADFIARKMDQADKKTL